MPAAYLARRDACPCVPGDLNRDGFANLGGVPPFAAVLLGTDNDPLQFQSADLNGDGVADGRYVQPFVHADSQ